MLIGGSGKLTLAQNQRWCVQQQTVVLGNMAGARHVRLIGVDAFREFVVVGPDVAVLVQLAEGGSAERLIDL